MLGSRSQPKVYANQFVQSNSVQFVSLLVNAKLVLTATDYRLTPPAAPWTAEWLNAQFVQTIQLAPLAMLALFSLIIPAL
jgi:hypothetical protein